MLKQDSYLILDEYMRFLNCTLPQQSMVDWPESKISQTVDRHARHEVFAGTGGAKKPTASLNDVPVISALRDAGMLKRS